jgi:hypothetical protein
LNATSSPPNVATVSCKAALTASLSATSTVSAIAWPPSASISLAVSGVVGFDQPGDGHGGAFGGEPQGGRPADAGAAAGDEGDLAVEPALGDAHVAHSVEWGGHRYPVLGVSITPDLCRSGEGLLRGVLADPPSPP